MRDDTLHSLNGLGKEYKMHFPSELVFMSPYAWDSDIENCKCEGIRYFRRLGYRVVAFVDNEPENLAAVSDMEDSDEIHASARGHAVRVSAVQAAADNRQRRHLRHAPSWHTFGRRFRDTFKFVWHGVRDTNSLSEFIESGVQWCEMDIRTDPVTWAACPDIRSY